MATTRHLLDDDWTLLGSGPLVVQLRTRWPACIHIAATAPAADEAAYHLLSAPSLTVLEYNGSDNVYARAETTVGSITTEVVVS